MIATITPAMRGRRLLMYIRIGLALSVMFTVALAVARGRAAGLSMMQALVSGLDSTWPVLALTALIFYILWGAIYLFMIDRPTTYTPDAIESGRARWKRMRLYISIGLVTVTMALAALLCLALVNGRWNHWFWLVVAEVLLALAFLLRYWVHQPGRDYLYVLGTGDTSRMNDERAQLISGKAANTTLWIVVTLVFYGGILYEVLILRGIPWRAYASIGVICLIYLLSRWYWRWKL